MSALPPDHHLARENPDGTVTITLGIPDVNDRVLTELRYCALKLGLPLSETLAYLLGLGHHAAMRLGVIRGRTLPPMSRRQLLEELRAMIERLPG